MTRPTLRRLRRLLPLLLLPGLALAAGLARRGDAAAPAGGSPTLDAVRHRGVLVCGVTTGVAGFSLPDSKGVWRGLDVDTCRAVAAAALGDADKVRYVATTTENRFTALQSGEVDMLARDTTWTLKREAAEGLEFAGINYYDGTGFLVKKSLGVTSAKQLDGATVCVEPGTSTELALADYFRRNHMRFKPVEIADYGTIQQAFLAGRCDAYSTDSSGLASFRYRQGAKASDFVLLPELISREPLGPVVRKGDDRWFDLVRWSLFAMLTAEEDGVTSQNVDSFANTTNPEIRRLLGMEGDLGKALGVDNKWAYDIIKQVGNFQEVWDRDIAPLGVPRGINNLWSKGGLHYPPPML
ncbi:MAG TPA: amino acid ABC transporter substrate-binding protein [Acetobacteraceae bacterium]|nr:amino acid ABC transporter substrate-binding protein [Acetobacteraceae bacterium]